MIKLVLSKESSIEGIAMKSQFQTPESQFKEMEMFCVPKSIERDL